MWRQQHAKPVAEALHTWLSEQRQKLAKADVTAKAIDYSLSNWWGLTRYLDDGGVPIDNNAAENAVRPLAVGRNNAKCVLMRTCHRSPRAPVSAIVGPMMVMLDRFVIGVLFGAKAVSYYTIPFQLAERTTLLPGALSFALFPRLTAAATQMDRQRLGAEWLIVLAVFLSPLIAVCLLLIGPFLAWWISADLASQSTRLGQILFLGFWINGLALVPHTQIYGAGRPDLVAKCHLAELPVYVTFLALALQAWGLAGAAAVFALRAAADFLLLTYFAGGVASSVRLLAWPGTLLGASLAVVTPGWLSPTAQFTLGGMLFIAMLAWSWHHAPALCRRPISAE